jgi:regulator of RNase E activity RraA
MVHKALQVARLPATSLWSTRVATRRGAVFGGLMCNSAAAAKLGGIVVDGAIRDIDDIRALEFPAYSRTVCAGGCDKDGPGEVNVPIAVRRVVVSPGDIIVGDDEGVVVIPRGDAEEVLKLVHALMDRERKRVAEIKAGVVFRPDVDELLRKRGVIE